MSTEDHGTGITLKRLEIPPTGIQTAIGQVHRFDSRTGPMVVLPAHDGMFLSRADALHLAAVIASIADPPGGET